MKKTLFFLSFILSIAFTAQAQQKVETTNALYYLIQDKLTSESFGLADPLFHETTASAATTGKLDQALTKYMTVILDLRNVRKLYAENRSSIEMIVPTASGDLHLQLTQQRNMTDDFVVKASGTGEIVPYQPGLYYRGIVKGDANSIAAVSIFEDEVIAMVSNDEGNFVIGKIDGKEYAKDAYIIYNDNDLKKSNPFDCHTDDESTMDMPRPTHVPADAMPGYVSTCKTVKVYIEADSLLNNNKGSILNTTNYVTGFFNIVATLYQRDSLFTEISQIKVWTTKEPYRATTSGDALNDFGMRVRDTFPGDVAHLVSLAGGYAYLGGVAWLDVLCASYFGSGSTHFSRTAYSGIETTYDPTLPVPVYSWTVEVFSHEMGHNLGSRHTHWCGWQLRPGKYGAIDSCYTLELYSGGCDTSGPVPSSSVKGTIMSYCHLVSAGIKFANGFGKLPGKTIRTEVAAATCLTNSCYCTDWVNLGLNRSVCDSIKLDGGTIYDSIRWSSGSTARYLTVKTTGSYWLKMCKGRCITYDTVVLTINTTTRRTINQAICNGSTYLFNGVNRTTAGTYKDTFTNSKGCDSVVTLNLTIKATSTRTINQSICNGRSYLFNGVNRTVAGTYLDTFANYLACDSVVTLNLVVLPTASRSITQTLCTGTTLLFNGVLLSSGGTYKDTFVSYNGCDSVVTLNLSFSSTLTGLINRTICAGQSVIFNGIARTTAGDYLDTLVSYGGCDSVLTLRLTVKPASTGSFGQTICDGGFYAFNGVNRTTAGSYLDTLVNYVGCDSVVTLNLAVRTINTATTQLGSTLTATLTGVTYQWINCDNGNSPIAGETNRSFTPTNNGNYAVVITDGSCKDTSACTFVGNVGVNNIANGAMIAIFPNPANQSFTIQSTNKEVRFVEVINNIGEIVLKKDISFGVETIDISKLAAALYIVKVKDKNETLLFQEKLNVIR